MQGVNVVVLLIEKKFKPNDKETKARKEKKTRMIGQKFVKSK